MIPYIKCQANQKLDSIRQFSFLFVILAAIFLYIFDEFRSLLKFESCVAKEFRRFVAQRRLRFDSFFFLFFTSRLVKNKREIFLYNNTSLQWRRGRV